MGWSTDVYPVVVLCNDFPQRHAQAGRLTYVAVGELVDWLLEQPRRIAPKDVETIGVVLHQLPAAADFGTSIHALEGKSAQSGLACSEPGSAVGIGPHHDGG
jgi:hypothetical protein